MEPEVETPVIDKPDSSPDTGATAPKAPEIPASETPPESAASAPDNVAVYQDVVAKFNEDNTYEMTDKESDAFLDVQDLINNGKMKEPLPQKLNKESTPKETPPEGNKKTPASEVKDKPDIDSEKKTPTGDSVSDNMMESMKKVGAKDVTELPGKIESLIRNRDESGGKLGSENAALKTKVGSLEQAATNHINFLNDLKAGKPEAVEYLTKDIGYVPNSSTPVPNSGLDEPESSGEFGNTEEYLDDKLAGQVKGQNVEIQALKKQIKKLSDRDKTREDEVLTSKATSGWVDDVVKLVTSPANQKVYGLAATEARGLAEQYFDKKQVGSPIHPKFQKVHELIMFAHENQMPTLEAAHVIHLHKSGAYAKQVVDAAKNGQQNFTPSVNSESSEKQSRAGNNIPDPAVSEEAVEQMEKGDFESIPDDWMDKQGNLIPAKVPQRFHAKAFGRAGKPKGG